MSGAHPDVAVGDVLKEPLPSSSSSSSHSHTLEGGRVVGAVRVPERHTATAIGGEPLAVGDREPIETLSRPDKHGIRPHAGPVA